MFPSIFAVEEVTWLNVTLSDVPNPKLVAAAVAVDAPVPPSVIGTSVPPALYIMLVCINYKSAYRREDIID